MAQDKEETAAKYSIVVPNAESWSRWLLRTLFAGIFYSLVSGAAVWAVGDRLLTHALAGLGLALDTTNKSVDSVRTEVLNLRSDINSIGSVAVDRFLASLKETSELEIRVTGDFANISQQLDELRSLINANSDEQARLIEMIKGIESSPK